MSSQAQIDANRRNAQQSTGPKSDAGKSTASQNAHQHGLCSRSGVAPGEDPAAYQAFALEIVAELNPVGMNQRVQAERIAFLTWKLQRIPAIEASTLEGTRRRFKHGALRNGHIRSQFPTPDLIAADLDTMMKLQNYEMRLSRALETARKELQRLQANAQARQQEAASPKQAASPPAPSPAAQPPESPTPAVPPPAPVASPKSVPDQPLGKNWLRSAAPLPTADPPSPQPPQEAAA